MNGIGRSRMPPMENETHGGSAHHRSHLAFQRGLLDKTADFLTEQFGSLWFLILNAIIFVGWIEWNLGWLGLPVFDPFPFGLLTMIVSLEAIFLAIFVLISQNRQSRIADIRQQVDMEIDTRAEAEIRKILRMLDEIRTYIAEKKDDPELVELVHEVDIATIQAEIERNSDF
jgi:uncharacterized membrane protein